MSVRPKYCSKIETNDHTIQTGCATIRVGPGHRLENLRFDCYIMIQIIDPRGIYVVGMKCEDAEECCSITINRNRERNWVCGTFAKHPPVGIAE